MAMNGWIGVDLDGTLAEYHGWIGSEHIGTPIPAMVERVKAWLAEGRDVRIFTARCYPLGTDAVGDFTRQGRLRVEDARRACEVIHEWSRKHLGRELPITCVKDFAMIELWDDRAVQVIPNQGTRADKTK